MTLLEGDFMRWGREALEGAANGLLLSVALVIVVVTLFRIFPRVNAATRYGVWLGLLVVLSLVTLFPRGATFPALRTSAATSERPGEEAQVDVPEAVLMGPPPVPGAEPKSKAKHSPSRGPKAEFGLPDVSRVAAAVEKPLSTGKPRAKSFWDVEVPGALGVGWLLAWFSVTAWALQRMLRTLVGLVRLKRRSRPLPALEARVEALRRDLGCRRRVGVRVSRHVSLPAALGYFRPVILMPPRLVWELKDQELDQVLLHELGHVARRDDWTTLFQRLVQAVFFFNPVVHWVGRRLDLDREIACDDAVLARQDPCHYASCLARVAELSLDERSFALAPAVLGRRSHFYRRIQAILGKRDGVGRGGSVSWAVGVIGLGLTLAWSDVPGSPRVAIKRAQEVPGAAATQGLTAQRRLVLGEDGVVAPPLPAQDEEARFSWRQGRKRYELTMRGCITLGPDDASVMRLPLGASAELVVRGGSEVRFRVASRPGNEAVAEVSVTADGSPTPWTDQYRELWEDSLSKSVSRTWIGVEGRVRRHVAGGGVSAALIEMRSLKGDAVVRRYVQELTAMGLAPADVPSVLRFSADTIKAPSHLVAVVKGLVSLATDDDLLTEKIIRSLRHVEDSSLRTQILGLVAAERPLRGSSARSWLAGVRKLCDGCGRTELLLREVNTFTQQPELVPDLLACARQLESDEARVKIFCAVVAAQGSASFVREVCAHARHLNHGRGRGYVLLAAARACRSLEDRAAVLDRIEMLETDPDRRAVLRGVLDGSNPTAELAERLIAAAGSIEGSRARADVLSEILATCPFDSLTAVAEASRHLGTDVDRVRVLKGVLARSAASGFTLRRVLEAASEIRSDHQKAILLIHAVAPMTGELLTAFLDATWSVRSESEKLRILTALVSQGKLEEYQLTRLLKAAREHLRKPSTWEILESLVTRRMA